MGTLALLVAAGFALTAAVPAAAQVPGRLVDTFDVAWKLILDTHFDPEMNGVDWQEVRDELRPRAEAAGSDAELRDVMREMIGRLGQSHFVLIPSAAEPSHDAREVDSGESPGAGPEERAAGDATRLEERDAGPTCGPELNARVLAVLEGTAASGAVGTGLEVRMVEGQIVATEVAAGSGAAEADLRPGSRLVALDGDEVDSIVACLGEEISGGERRVLATTVVTALLAGEPGSTVRLEIEDGSGSLRTVDLERRLAPGVTTVTFGNLPPLPTRLDWRFIERADRRIGLVDFNIWMVPIAPRFEEAVAAMRDADGFVLDLRGNPGGIAALAQGIAGYFVGERESLGTILGRRSELELRINPRRVLASGERFEPYEGPLAILVDSGSASTSEIFAAGLQDLGRARLFGEATAGAALPAQAKRLPNGDVLMHATGDFVRPRGERIEGRPVEPDEVVPLTRRGLLDGEDEPLEAALRWIAHEGGAGDRE